MSDPELLPVEFQLIAGLLLLALLVWVIYLIRCHKLGLRESLLWLLSTVLAMVLTAFPSLLQQLALAVGVRVPSNALFALGFVYVLVNLLSITIVSSRHASQVRRLSQECAMLRAEIEELRASVAPTFERERR